MSISLAHDAGSGNKCRVSGTGLFAAFLKGLTFPYLDSENLSYYLALKLSPGNIVI